jgi:hypothetical protein
MDRFNRISGSGNKPVEQGVVSGGREKPLVRKTGFYLFSTLFSSRKNTANI